MPSLTSNACCVQAVAYRKPLFRKQKAFRRSGEQTELGSTSVSGAPTDAAVRAEIERILADPRFVRAHQLARLLRFIVDETLLGRGDDLKEYTIGIEVFGRSVTYDPRLDSIVRVQARLLRLKLAEYYQSNGAGDPVVLELPKGTYIPSFRHGSVSVDPRDASLPTNVATGPSRLDWRIAGVGGVLLFLLGASVPFRDRLLGLSQSGAALTEASQSIAVVPFRNLGANPDDDYLGEGLRDEVTSALRKVGGLRVVAVPTSVASPGGSMDLREVGRRVDAETVVEGSVRREGHRLQISVQVVRLSDGATIWADSVEGDRIAMIEFQVRMAAAIAAAFAVRLQPDARKRLEASTTTDPETHRLYLQARYFWNTRSKAGVEKAIALFQSAIERDPGFAPAHAGLADAYAMGVWYIPLPSVEAAALAKRAALSAVRLDPMLAEAHSALGSAYAVDWQWAESARSLERAVQLDPAYPRAHHANAYILMLLGRTDQALVEIRRAQRLDPLSPVINADVVELLHHAGRYEEAIEQSKVALKLAPEFPLTYWALGFSLLRTGRDEEAVAALLKEKALKGTSRELMSALESAFARGGWPAYWRTELEFKQKEPHASAYEIARLYGRLGLVDQSFAWLERAYAQHDAMLSNLKFGLQWELGSDPRFKELLGRLGVAN